MKQIGKRTISLFIAMVILFGMMPMNVFAETSDLTLRVESVKGPAGAEVQVDLLLENNPGISSIGLTLVYDSILDLRSVDFNEDMGGSTQISQTLNSPVKLIWVNGTTDFTEESAVFATLTFQISESVTDEEVANITIIHDPADIFNSDYVDIPMNVINGTVTVFPCIPGDINGDGAVNNKDVAFIMRYLAGWDVTVDEVALDINGDGSINNKDVSILMRYLAGWEVTIYYGEIISQRCNHTMEEIAFKAATCTEPGNIAYWHCTKCDKYFTSELGTAEIKLEDTVIQPSHTLEHLEYKAATSSEPGNIDCWHCTVCSKYFMDENASQEIDYTEVVLPVVEAGKTTVVYAIDNGDEYLRSLQVENPNADEFVSAEGLTLNPLTAPEGYLFKGWRLVDGTDDGTPITKIPAQEPGTTVMVKAVWELIPYTITYKNYKTPVGKISDETEKVYYVNQGKVNLPNPDIKNFIFLGWYDESGEEVESIPAGTTGNIVLNGYYTSYRNLAIAQELGDPIILEDNSNYVIYFIYELGTIKNIPLFKISDKLDSRAGIQQEITYEYSEEETVTDAETIAKTIADATVDSGTWSLSEGWNQATQVNETWAKENGMTLSEAEEKAKTASGTYSLTTYDERNVTNTDNTGTTTVAYNSQKNTEGSKIELDVGLSGKMSIGGFAGEYEIGGHIDQNSEEHNDEEKHTGTDQTTLNTSVDTTTTHTGTAKVNSNTTTESERNVVSTALSEIICNTKGYGKTYVADQQMGRTKTDSYSESKSSTETSMLTMFTGTKQTTTKKYTITGELQGWYQLVTAGTAHVFGVVEYDVAQSTYFFNTYSIMDDNTYEFLDYSTDEDFDNKPIKNEQAASVLPFEVPYFVYEYVASKVACTEGLIFTTNSEEKTAKVKGYTGEDTDVYIPDYTYLEGEAYKVTEIEPNVFAGKSIHAIRLSSFIEEIPNKAFYGCTSLSEISGSFTRIGSEAFSGCTALADFNISKYVTDIGEDAFADVGAIKLNALSEEAALAWAKKQNPDAGEESLNKSAVEVTQNVVCAAVRSGAKNITVDLSAIMDGTRLELDVPDTVEKFELDGGGKTFSNMKLISHAASTVICKATIENYADVPVTVYSDSLTLNIANIKSSGFALVLTSEQPTVSLYSDSRIYSVIGKAVVCKNPTFIGELMGKIEGTLVVEGNVYLCGSIVGEEQLTINRGQIWEMSESNFAKFVNGGFTVTLDPNGGSVSTESITLPFGKAYGNLPEPVRTNYQFAGWYTEIEGGNLITENTIFEELNDVVLYAHWTLNTFNIIFDATGGSVGTGSKTVTYDAPVGALPTPQRDYYVFDGWYTSVDGGDKYTADTVYKTMGDIILYAHWTLKPVSDWVLADSIPTDAQVVEEKWTYDLRTNIESRDTSLPGYTQYGYYWVKSDQGYCNYASFPSGFDTSNSIYTSFAKSPYTASETQTTKREVENVWGGYVYYHWVYNAPFANRTDRSVSSKFLASGTDGYWYGYFYAFTNSTAFPYLDNSYCNNQNLPSYNCWSALSQYNGQNINGLCSPRFFRFDYYLSYYTDYYKMFQYYKLEQKESSSVVVETDLVSNVQHWVKYREK